MEFKHYFYALQKRRATKILMRAIIKYIRYIPMSEHKASFKKLCERLFTTGSSLFISVS